VGDTVLEPIDYLALERPERHVTGEGFRLLMDLVERDIVRVLDVLFVAKDADGKVSTVEVTDVEYSDALDERLWGLPSGLLDQSDIYEVAGAIEPGSLAEILVYENVLAVAMRTAMDRGSGRLVGAGWVVADDLIAGLDTSNPALKPSFHRSAYGTIENRAEGGRRGEDGGCNPRARPRAPAGARGCARSPSTGCCSAGSRTDARGAGSGTAGHGLEARAAQATRRPKDSRRVDGHRVRGPEGAHIERLTGSPRPQVSSVRGEA
jgi:Family of unknown function (DUF6325)